MSDAGAKKSRFRRRRPRCALLRSDTMGHDDLGNRLAEGRDDAVDQAGATGRRLERLRARGCPFGPRLVARRRIRGGLRRLVRPARCALVLAGAVGLILRLVDLGQPTG